MRRSSFIIIIFLSFFLLIYLFIDFFRFASDMKSEWRLPERADMIVVLAGGLGRIEEGMRLLSAGIAPFLVISGAGKEAGFNTISQRKDMVEKISSGHIIIEKESGSTYQNAIKVSQLMRSYGVKNIILITSNYHMKRSMFIFRRVLPHEIDIIPFGISSPNFNENGWYGDFRSLKILIKEFIKYKLLPIEILLVKLKII